MLHAQIAIPFPLSKDKELLNEPVESPSNHSSDLDAPPPALDK